MIVREKLILRKVELVETTPANNFM